MRHALIIVTILALTGCGMTPTPPAPPEDEDLIYCQPAFYIDPGTGEWISLCPGAPLPTIPIGTPPSAKVEGDGAR